MTFAEIGKRRRLDRLFKDGKIIVVPVDDSLIFGPYEGLYDLDHTLSIIEQSSPSAILGYKGSLSHVSNNGIPLILNVTASTTTGNHVLKIVSGSVIDAVKMDVTCVAAHVNYAGEYENQMMQQLANVISEADQYGLPVLAISYPRKCVDNKDYNYHDINESAYTDLVCHCTRTSAELGADIIKTQYTGSTKSFERVVKSSLGKPVVIAGGPLIEVEKAYEMAKSVMDAGGAGISYGRNVFNQKNIKPFISGLKAIVFNRSDVSKAMEIYRGGC